MFTYSENPQRDLWEHLKFLTAESNCKRLLSGEIKSNRPFPYNDDEILKKKATQISMCIKQAYEYFNAAESVTINTSPLLIFYGMLSLTKALTIANFKNLFIENIKYHGLESRPRHDFLKSYQENPALWTMEDEFAVTNEGVFNYLMQILDNKSFNKYSVIKFKDIIRIAPELWGIFYKYYGERPDILGLYICEEEQSESYSLRIAIPELDEKEIYKVFPELQRDFELKPEILHTYNREFISKNIVKFPEYLRVIKPQHGGNYFTAGINYFDGSKYDKLAISEGCCDYLAMYILSVCVRYKQDFWGEIISGKSSGVLSLIELYISSIKRRFPNIILNSIFNEGFFYGISSYF